MSSFPILNLNRQPQTFLPPPRLPAPAEPTPVPPVLTQFQPLFDRWRISLRSRFLCLCLMSFCFLTGTGCLTVKTRPEASQDYRETPGEDTGGGILERNVGFSRWKRGLMEVCSKRSQTSVWPSVCVRARVSVRARCCVRVSGKSSRVCLRISYFKKSEHLTFSRLIARELEYFKYLTVSVPIITTNR